MENNRNEKLKSASCNMNMENRERLQITGVNEVVSFNEDEIFLNTQLGALRIKGDELKMNKLDVQSGDVLIVGNIDSCAYSNNYKAKKNEGILAKLFK